MWDFLEAAAVIFGFIVVAFLLLHIKYLFTGKELSGTCASNSPYLREQLGTTCPVCGSQPGEACKAEEEAPAKNTTSLS